MVLLVGEMALVSYPHFFFFFFPIHISNITQGYGLLVMKQPSVVEKLKPKCKILVMAAIHLFFQKLLIYLAALGLSCSTWDLHCGMKGLQLRHVSSQLWHVGSRFPDQGLNSSPRIGSVGSQLLDYQGSPYHSFIFLWFFLLSLFVRQSVLLHHFKLFVLKYPIFYKFSQS